MSQLPIIDFSPFLDPGSTIEAKRTPALQIDQACREVGFFYLSNHGVNLTLMEAMVRNARIFFKTATQDEKDAIAWKKAGDGDGDGARGWQKSGGGARGAHEVSKPEFLRPL
jgi:isopenicillin N synthase-like dioxygenase